MASMENDTVSTELSMSTKSGYGIEAPALKSPAKKEKKVMAETWSEMIRLWPYQTFLIMLMEFSISLTALNNVFNLYYINVLGFNPDRTVTLLNVVGIFAGCCRLFCSGLSDSYLGKFRAILIGGCIYIVGKFIMFYSTFYNHQGLPHPYLDFVAHFIIITGVSTFSPNVNPFCGDQFEPHQEKMISTFYSGFYASFNVAALVSNSVMPKLRAHPCFGRDSCYPLTFGVTTAGAVIAAIFFMIGYKWYIKNPPAGSNIFADVYNLVKTARTNKRNCSDSKLDDRHWLEYYFNTHVCEKDRKCLELRKKEEDDTLCHKRIFVADFHALLRLLIVFIPMPMFWALYDQQYNVWTNQALYLDSHIYGGFQLLPDQMQVVNPALIILLIALFQFVIYPLLGLVVRLTPLRKMVAGFFIAAVAFLASGLVQLKINPTMPEIPSKGDAFVSVVNAHTANCTLNVTHVESGEWRVVPWNQSLVNDKLVGRREQFTVLFEKESNWEMSWSENKNNSECDQLVDPKVNFKITNTTALLTVTPNGTFYDFPDAEKPTGGSGQFKIGVVLAFHEMPGDDPIIAFCRIGTKCDQHAGKDFFLFVNKERKLDNHQLKYFGDKKLRVIQYPYIEVQQGSWQLFEIHNKFDDIMKEDLNVTQINANFTMEQQGGVYTMVVSGDRGDPKVTVHQVAPHNSVSILWQIPQIFIISVAEILVSITGMEFAFTQSGTTMKAIAAACWSVTGSLGSIFIIFITEFGPENLAHRAFIGAGGMFLDVFLLAYLAMYHYEYREGTIDDGEARTAKSADDTQEVTKSHRNSVYSRASLNGEFEKLGYVHESGADGNGYVTS